MFHPHGGYHGYSGHPGQFPAPPPSPPSASGQLEDPDETVTIKHVPYMRWEEDENDVKLAVDVAGFKAKDLELSISKQHLLIKGDRRNKFGDSFVLKREIYLNALIYDESAVEAIYEQDLLEITIPKKKKDVDLESRVIPIHFPSGMEDDSMMEAEVVIVNNENK
jgi:HSP20 family molecular chaperone IbpA